MKESHELTRPVDDESKTEKQERLRTFLPDVDIEEQDREIRVLADMPGVDETSIDVTLEKNVLTLRGRMKASPVEKGYAGTYQEFELGNYERAFTISNEIDRNRIEARIRNGVLEVVLPKAPEFEPKKISVRVH